MVKSGIHTIPQDSVKGWVAVFAAFLAHVITHGILYSFGVLFITLQDNYSGSKADIAWIGSLATGAVYLIGEIEYFVNLYDTIETQSSSMVLLHIQYTRMYSCNIY